MVVKRASPLVGWRVRRHACDARGPRGHPESARLRTHAVAGNRGCDREGPQVHDWCDGNKGPVTCVSEEETRKAKRGVEDAKKNIEDPKDKKSKTERNRSNATTEDGKKK